MRSDVKPDSVLGCRPGMARALRKDSAAGNDLIGIWLYTFETWSETQADHYLDLLERGIRAVAEAPRQGRLRSELKPGYWSRRIEHHVVFYTFDGEELRVRRVLHEVMDLERHLR